MKLLLDPTSMDSYRTFLAAKRLPRYKVQGRTISFPDEYADRLGINVNQNSTSEYVPHCNDLFDYQRDITRLSCRKQRFALFADPGLGKTLCILEWMKHALSQLPQDRRVLLISPLNVTPQTISEARRFYGESLAIGQVLKSELQGWLNGEIGGDFRLGITNYEAIVDGLKPGLLGGLALDESSSLKNHSSTYATRIIDLGKGLQWKLCATGTPAPNDRIEFANHGVFLDKFPTVNSFLARYFVNRGETANRWELKHHALEAFYRDLSDWCIFLSNPAVYGWKDNCGTIPPIFVHTHHVELTEEQETIVNKDTGMLFAHKAGGIAARAKWSQLAKGIHKKKGKKGEPSQSIEVATLKYDYIRNLVAGWTPQESTIIWCWYNHEQEKLAAIFGDLAASIDGTTKLGKRLELIDDFKSKRRPIMISKPEVMGYGLNLQVCTRMVFSSLIDSYEKYYQCVKRANRVGSTLPLNVHIPITEIEQPMVETVLKKAKRVQSDSDEQERIFRTVNGLGKETKENWN